jgi:hypothetical protein
MDSGNSDARRSDSLMRSTLIWERVAEMASRERTSLGGWLEKRSVGSPDQLEKSRWGSVSERGATRRDAHAFCCWSLVVAEYGYEVQ